MVSAHSKPLKSNLKNYEKDNFKQMQSISSFFLKASVISQSQMGG